MKKLTLLITMLMVTSAWANDVFDDLANPTKHMDCDIGDITIRLAFTPSQAGIVSYEQWMMGMCVSTPCMKEGEFTRTENMYTFAFMVSERMGEILELNRKDLTFKHQFYGIDLPPDYGVCKIVQRSTKKNKI